MTPSPAQVEAFQRRCAVRPVVLLVQYELPQGMDAIARLQQLRSLAASTGGTVIWAARAQQVLVGDLLQPGQVVQVRFADSREALVFAEALTAALPDLGALQVVVLTVQPRRVARIARLLGWVLPRLPFDNTIDPAEEPGLGTSSVMPTREAVDALKSHPVQDAPVTMINWLKFRATASYAGEVPAVDGRTAYYRYGKVALITTHSIGARLLYAGRYLLTLVGNGGDPGEGRWDEFVLMQYPGRAAFTHMTSLRRYRRALHHREAGLAERGQGLVVTEPAGA